MKLNRAALAQRRRVLFRRAANRLGLDITRHPYGHRLVRMLRLLGTETIVDIGANEGQYARYLRDSGFAGRIVSVEPLARPFQRLARRAAADPDWETVHSAVSDRPGSLTIHVSANSVSSSALPMLAAHARVDPNSTYVDDERVPATTVDRLVEECGIDPSTSLLKIDVQGLESAVLDGASATLVSFAAVELELSLVPLYDEESLMAELVSRMEDARFDLWILEPGFWDVATSRTLQCDGVFVNRKWDVPAARP